eukprot:7377226-Prymnesium_polylepis.1
MRPKAKPTVFRRVRGWSRGGRGAGMAGPAQSLATAAPEPAKARAAAQVELMESDEQPTSAALCIGVWLRKCARSGCVF